MGGLISSGEVKDVLTPDSGKKTSKGRKFMENLGGYAIVQFTANLQREVGKGTNRLKGKSYKVSLLQLLSIHRPYIRGRQILLPTK